jgi:outer membrane protein OmpA-like peptidoglycan-associated protein
MSVSVAALAGEPKTTPPQEPVGFVAGGIIGGFAAGPLGAVVGAGLGTWLGNRVHRAGEAKKAEAQLAVLRNDNSTLESDKIQLQTEKAALVGATGELASANRSLTARIDELSKGVEAAQKAADEAAGDETASVLDGLQGDVLFRTGSAEIAPDVKQGLQVLAEAVAKSPALKVRFDGYADPRGGVDTNLKLSEERANAVRDLFLAAGVSGEALEVNAYGKSQSVAADYDGFAFERRVRLTLEAAGQGNAGETAANVATAAVSPTAEGASAAPPRANEAK